MLLSAIVFHIQRIRIADYLMRNKDFTTPSTLTEIHFSFEHG